MKKRSLLSALLVLLMVMSFILVPARQAEAASKKTVYVLTGINFVTEEGKKIKVHKYSYNKKGMLKSGVRGQGLFQMKFAYDKKGRLKTYQTRFNEWQVRKYTYNKKGKISKVDTTYLDASTNKFAYDGFHSVYKFNSKKQVVQETAAGSAWDEKLEKNVKVTYDIRYSYDKKGRLAEKVNKTTGDSVKLIYDKKGSVGTMIYKSGDYTSTSKSKNSYNKKGLLIKMEENTEDSTGDKSVSVYTYEYKKMKVKKSMVKKIKAQQEALMNQGLNFTIPDNDYAYGLY